MTQDCLVISNCTEDKESHNASALARNLKPVLTLGPETTRKTDPTGLASNSYKMWELTNAGAHASNGNTTSFSRRDVFAESTKSWIGLAPEETPSEVSQSVDWVEGLGAFLSHNDVVGRYTMVSTLGTAAVPSATAPALGDMTSLRLDVAATAETSRGAGSSMMSAFVHRGNYARSTTVSTRTPVLGMGADSTELDRFSRRLKSGLPGVDPTTAGEIADVLSGAQDEVTHFAGLYYRILALAEAFAAGAALAAIAPVNLATLWPAGPQAPGAVNIWSEMKDRMYDVHNGVSDGVFVPGYHTTNRLSNGALGLLYLCGLANCGVLPVGAGQPVRGVAGEVTATMPVRIYGPVSLRPNIAAAAAPVWADFNTLLRWLVSTTGDKFGYLSAFADLAGRVRFEGPEYTNLAVGINSRFRPPNAVAANRFRFIYELGQSIAGQAWTQWITANAPITAAVAVPANIAALGVVPVTLPGALAFAAGYDTHQLWEECLTSASCRMLGALIVAGDPTLLVPGVAGGDFAGVATWNTNHGLSENSLSADGVDGELTVYCSTGLTRLRVRMSGATGIPPAVQFNGFTQGQFLQTLYSVAAIRRSLTDTVVSSVRYCTAVQNMIHGTYATGNVDVDTELGLMHADSQYIEPETLFGLGWSNFASLFGTVGSEPPMSVEGAAWPHSPFRMDSVMPVAFASQFRTLLISWAHGVGGAVSPHGMAQFRAGSDNGPLFSKSGLVADDLTTMDIAGVYQVAAHLSGVRMALGATLQVKGQYYSTLNQVTVDLSPVSGTRISDHTLDTGTLLVPTCAWVALGLPNYKLTWVRAVSVPSSHAGYWGPLGQFLGGPAGQDNVADYDAALPNWRSSSIAVTNIRRYTRLIPAINVPVAAAPLTGSQIQDYSQMIVGHLLNSKSMTVTYSAVKSFRHSVKESHNSDSLQGLLSRLWKSDLSVPNWSIKVLTGVSWSKEALASLEQSSAEVNVGEKAVNPRLTGFMTKMGVAWKAPQVKTITQPPESGAGIKPVGVVEQAAGAGGSVGAGGPAQPGF